MCIHFYIGANIHQSHGSVGLASVYIFTSELTFINPTDPWDWQVLTQLSNDADIHQSHGSLGLASVYAVEQRCRHSPIPRIRGIDACAYIFTSELTFINPTDPWDWQVFTQLSNDADIHQSHGSVELMHVHTFLHQS